MTINRPCVITSQLEAGLRLADGSELSITYSNRDGCEGRTRYSYTIDLNDDSGCTYTNDDLQSGCQGGNLQDGLKSLLSFLGSADEEMFPAFVCEWASQNDMELTAAQMDLEECEAIVE